MGVATICQRRSLIGGIKFLCRDLHVVQVCIQFDKLRCLDRSVAGSDVLDVCGLQKSTIAMNGRIHGAATDRPTGWKQMSYPTRFSFGLVAMSILSTLFNHQCDVL